MAANGKGDNPAIGVAGLVVLAAVIGVGDIVAGQELSTFLVLAAASVVARHLRATAPPAGLVDVILLYRALWLLGRLFGVYQYVPPPFPELVIVVGLVGFNRYLRGRSWEEMTLRRPASARAWVPTIPLAILAIAGLAWWYFLVAERPHPMGRLLPPWSTATLLAVAPVVATAITVHEELLARVILQCEARRVAGAWSAITFQAVLFGTMHYQFGFPRGWVGVGLTFAFGFVMGVLTYKTRSVWPAVVVHVLCDVFIISLVVLERG